MSYSTKNSAYKNINSSSMIYVEPPKKVLPEKNSGYKNVNSSSMIYVEPPKKVLPDKNSAYKNINSSSPSELNEFFTERYK